MRENVTEDALLDALHELLRWQPHTDTVRATLHPQHRAAIEQAERALSESRKHGDS